MAFNDNSALGTSNNSERRRRNMPSTIEGKHGHRSRYRELQFNLVRGTPHDEGKGTSVGSSEEPGQG